MKWWKVRLIISFAMSSFPGYPKRPLIFGLILSNEINRSTLLSHHVTGCEFNSILNSSLMRFSRVTRVTVTRLLSSWIKGIGYTVSHSCQVTINSRWAGISNTFTKRSSVVLISFLGKFSYLLRYDTTGRKAFISVFLSETGITSIYASNCCGINVFQLFTSVSLT